METVKLVPCSERFTAVMGARSSCRARASVIGMQIRPRPCLAMKLIASGVTQSAAMIRSPSFSRSSSSTRTAMRPALSSAMIAGTGLIALAAAGAAGNSPPSTACRCAVTRLPTLQMGPALYCAARTTPLGLWRWRYDALEDGAHRLGQGTVRVAQIGQHAEMMALGEQQRTVSPTGVAFGPALPEQPRLADEFARLVGARRDDQRHGRVRPQVDRAHGPRLGGIELQVVIERDLQ